MPLTGSVVEQMLARFQKSIDHNQRNDNRTNSIITINSVIDFYRFRVDGFESATIDNDRILSTIEIIDMLRPVHNLQKYVMKLKCPIKGTASIPYIHKAYNTAC